MQRYVILGFLMLASGQAVAADPDYGRMMGQTCAGCHGTDGVPAVSYIPPLAGLKREAFITAMVAYREGTRKATIMNRVAPAFTDAEIAAMADYFAALPPPVIAAPIRLAPSATE